MKALIIYILLSFYLNVSVSLRKPNYFSSLKYVASTKLLLLMNNLGGAGMN